MEQIYKEKEKRKSQIVTTVMFAALILMGGFGVITVSAIVGNGYAIVNMVAVTRQGITALTIAGPLDISIGNTTTSMTTMFVTLIGLMIPLIIIMAYLGIFQDFIGGLGRAFGGMFGRRN